MLPDTNDDLLSQLSCELGLSDFMEQGSSILEEDGRSNNLYDQFLASVENEEHNTLFNELIESDGKICKTFVLFPSDVPASEKSLPPELIVILVLSLLKNS